MPTLHLKYIALVCLSFLVTVDCSAQKENLSVYPEWKYYGDVSNTLYKKLCERAFMQLEKRDRKIEAMEDVSDYSAYQAQVRAKMLEMVGPFPQKTPLNAVTTGVITEDDYRIEKVYFESLPQYFVTAALFIPANRKGKLPAILFCSGHSDDGFRGASYQHAILNLVKKGFAVLAFDPIGQGERIQYFDDKGQSRLGPTREHSYPGTQVFLSGRSPAHYFVWDGIRALDYLATRADIIDMNRIGITGRSGGGTQSTFISAMDERIKASVTESYITSYDKLLKSVGPTDAEQTLLYALHNQMDFPDFLIARAPKPVMIISTRGDFFSIQGARDTHTQTRKFYDVLGQAQNISYSEDDGPHASTVKNREAMYSFFQKHLDNPGSSQDEVVKTMDTELLQVTKDGNVFRSLSSKSLFDLNKTLFAQLSKEQSAVLVESERPVEFTKEDIVSITGYSEPGSFEPAIFCGRLKRESYSIEKYLVRGGGDYFIPVLWFRPFDSNKEVLLLVDEQGKESAAAAPGLADALAKKGYQVVLPDLVGVGELGGGFNRGSAFINNVPLNVWYMSVLTRETIASLRMVEIKNLHHFIWNNTTGKNSITAIAKGTLCTDLLYLSAIDNPFQKVVLINPVISIRSLVEERNYEPKYVISAIPGAALRFDIADLISLTAEKAKVLSVNPVNAKGEIAKGATVRTIYSPLSGKQTGPSRGGFELILKEDYIADVQNFLKED